MNSVLKKDLTVYTSHCDSSAKMGIPNAFSIFMDLATEHANELGVGSEVLTPKGLLWVASKTKAIFYNRPAMMQKTEISTWPEKPERIRFNRNYAIKSGDELLISGKTEWAIIDKQSGRPQKSDGIYPSKLDFCEDKLIVEPFSKIDTNFEGCQLLCCYKVKSTDIDLYGHMNNVAYVRAIMEMFSSKELEEMNIKSFEINYRIPCFEGEALNVYKRDTDNGFEIGMINADQKASTLFKIETGF